ncbi:MAG: phosphate transport system protein [Mycobacterium sp.]|nr:phosphate transport system protein [Mycobacterium sp.]
MRRDFHRQLELLRADVGTMCELTGRAAGRATTALLDVDAEAAGQVLVEADHLKLLNTAVERRAVSILARQAPVAGDLRATVTAIQIAADAERMGALAAHVARVCLRRDPEPVVPGELRECFRQMGEIAVVLAERSRAAALAGDCAQAHRVRDDDQAMEDLHRYLFRVVSSPRWSHGPGVAIDIVLLGRFYGRFADHAGEIARRVIFQTTGSYESVPTGQFVTPA